MHSCRRFSIRTGAAWTLHSSRPTGLVMNRVSPNVWSGDWAVSQQREPLRQHPAGRAIVLDTNRGGQGDCQPRLIENVAISATAGTYKVAILYGTNNYETGTAHVTNGSATVTGQRDSVHQGIQGQPDAHCRGRELRGRRASERHVPYARGSVRRLLQYGCTVFRWGMVFDSSRSRCRPADIPLRHVFRRDNDRRPCLRRVASRDRHAWRAAT